MFSSNLVDVTVFDVAEFGTQFLEAQEVGVQAPAPYLVAARLGHNGLAHAGQQRSYHHHRATQLGTLLHKLVTLKIVHVQTVGLEGIGTVAASLHLHANVLQQLDEVVDVADVGDIMDGYCLGGEQRCTDDLQCLVLGSLRSDITFERMAAFYLE